MLRDADAHFGLGCGGTSVADGLAIVPEQPRLEISERLALSREAIACVIGGRKVLLNLEKIAGDHGFVPVSALVGTERCRLHFSGKLMEWLQQPLGLEGALVDEEPLQRALLLELASLDILRLVETHLGNDIRFAEEGQGELPYCLDISIEAEGGVMPFRLELTQGLAETIVDFLDRLRPPKPVDLSGVEVEMVIEAGSQDLTVDELESLQPGDVVMLSSYRPLAVLNGALAAAVRRRSDTIELDGPFHHRSVRAKAGSLADIRSSRDSLHLLQLTAEIARTTMTLGGIDGLKTRQPLPLSSFDEMGVDLVIENRRFGRGDIVSIGEGVGIRIVSLLPTAADSQTS